MKISKNFDANHIKSFSSNFDRKLLRHIQKLKSPDSKIKQAMIYFVKTGGKRIRPFFIYRMGLFLNIKPKALEEVHQHIQDHLYLLYDKFRTYQVRYRYLV